LIVTGLHENKSILLLTELLLIIFFQLQTCYFEMKLNDLKTAAGFEPIKTKSLQLPLDVLDVKSR